MNCFLAVFFSFLFFFLFLLSILYRDPPFLMPLMALPVFSLPFPASFPALATVWRTESGFNLLALAAKLCSVFRLIAALNF